MSYQTPLNIPTWWKFTTLVKQRDALKIKSDKEDCCSQLCTHYGCTWLVDNSANSLGISHHAAYEWDNKEMLGAN